MKRQDLERRLQHLERGERPAVEPYDQFLEGFDERLYWGTATQEDFRRYYEEGGVVDDELRMVIVEVAADFVDGTRPPFRPAPWGRSYGPEANFIQALTIDADDPVADGVWESINIRRVACRPRERTHENCRLSRAQQWLEIELEVKILEHEFDTLRRRVLEEVARRRAEGTSTAGHNQTEPDTGTQEVEAS